LGIDALLCDLKNRLKDIYGEKLKKFSYTDLTPEGIMMKGQIWM